MTVPLKKFCILLVTSKTLTKEAVEAAYKKWRADFPADKDDVQSFMRFLVQSGQVPEAAITTLLAPASPVVEPASPPIVPQFDVELVVAPNRLTRRDVVMLAIGLAVGLAVAVAALVSR